MRGSIRAVPGRKNYWELSVSAGRDRATGKYLRIRKGFAGKKKDADEELRRMVDSVEAGRTGGSAGTLGNLLEVWFDTGRGPKGRAWSPSTRTRYRNLLDVHVLPALGEIQLRKLTVHDLDELYEKMLQEGLKPASVRQAHAIIRRALNEAVRKGWVVSNVARSAAPPGIEPEQLVVPSTAEVLALIDEAKASRNPDMASFLFVAATTGMRRGELVGLRWADVDLKRGMLKVHRSAVEDGRRVVVKDTKTHADRKIALDDATVGVLAAHRKEMEARAALLEGALVSGAHVWSWSRDGSEPWRPSATTLAMTRLRDRLELGHVHLHSLRHWAATSAIAGGDDIRTVAGRLGHAKTSTTLDVYAGFVAARDRQVADRLGGMLARQDAEAEQRRLSEAAVEGFRRR